jgi:hypothetical protein
MRIIKLILISAVVFFLLLTAITSLMPSSIRVSRAIDINAPASIIKEHIANLNGWDYWEEYTHSFTNKKISPTKIEADSITVTLQQVSDTLITTLWQQKGNHFIGGYTIIKQQENLTTVQSYYDFTLAWYPWEKLQGIIYDERLGPGMEKSLKQLKQLTEASYK